jgi:hypothetical protein
VWEQPTASGVERGGNFRAEIILHICRDIELVGPLTGAPTILAAKDG